MMLKKKRGYIGIPTVLVLAVLLSLLSPMALATSLTDTISETGITAVVEYEPGTEVSQMPFFNGLATRGEDAPNVTAEFSYNLVLNETAENIKASVELQFYSGDTTYETHLEGQLEQVELSDDITLIEGGPLEGEISIGTETYHIMSSFQKRIGTEGACLGISMKKQDSEEFPVFLRVGESVYTDEIKALHPLYSEDTNDLDGQLFETFKSASDFLRQTPVRMDSRQEVKDFLGNRQTGGIVFSTIQKFVEETGLLSERHNIVVMVDEAHRTQYGLDGKFDLDKGEMKYGYAKYLREALPNATYIAFTGTPIETTDKSTYGVFGDLIDVYDMTQAVDDGATVKIYYESRLAKVQLDERKLQEIDDEYWSMQVNEGVEDYVVEQSQKQMSRMEQIITHPQRIHEVVSDLIEHYEQRQDLVAGKAMIVAYSRPIAMKIYRRILELRPAWTEKVAVVMTQGNNDPEEWRQIIGNKAHKDDLARKFKSNDSPLKIAIVVDMWLTGFDVPSLATMYVYKPMSGHNLMQAIARVNRVFRDKEGGLVVDYVGIASALKKAMNDYTVRDKKNYGDPDVGKAAYPKFQEKLEVCRGLFHGFDYSLFLTGNDLEKARMISGGVNFLLGKTVAEHDLSDVEKTQTVYIKEALLLKQALSLCSSMVDAKTRFEAAFFEAVRTMLVRLTNDGAGKKFTLPEVNERINELLKHSIKSEGVINLFSSVDTEFSLFDPKFLEEVANMKEKNLAVELLKKLISEQVSAYRRTNLVKSQKFSEIIQSTMNRYLNGLLTNEEVIQELLNLAKEIVNANTEGEKLGLTAEELAFYDALTKPQAIKDFYEHDELIAITKELTDLLRKNRTIDWQKKESARAGMRRLVKRLLKKHKYPPEGMDDAVQTVMGQCEMWTDNQVTA